MSIIQSANYIAGQWQSTGSGAFVEVVDKFSGKVLANIPQASDQQMEDAIASAVSAFSAFKTWNAGQRSAVLETLATKLEVKADAFAELIAAEAGKPIGYAKGEIARCIVTLRTAAAEALRFDGEVVPMDFDGGAGKTAFTKRFPIGPVSAISPFNFPLNLALHKIAPALAVGCTIVLKPSPFAPLTSLAFAALCDETDLPKGAISVLLADIPQAEKLVTDERMKLLSFTGSPSVGWKLKGLSGKKKTVLELGGNAAVLVDETADLKLAAKTIAYGGYLYAGQICISTQRVFATQSVFEDFKALLIRETEVLQTGNPMAEAVTAGPIISTEHLQRIENWVQEAVDAGAHVLCGGKVLDREHNLYANTLLTNTSSSMKVVSEEVFGPVMVLESVSDFEAGLSAINDSKFGLQAGVFTTNLNRMKQAHTQLEVGGIMINNVPGFRIDPMPYGGVKDSGLGREGLRYAMEDMTEPRLLVY